MNSADRRAVPAELFARPPSRRQTIDARAAPRRRFAGTGLVVGLGAAAAFIAAWPALAG